MAQMRLQEELDALAVRLGRSLTIDTPDGQLLAYSTQRDDADQARISSILLRHVAPEVLEWELRHLDRDAIEPVVIPANPALGMSARLCAPLHNGGRTLGYLWMLHSGDELGADELQMLRRGADAIARILDGPADATQPWHTPGGEIDRLVRGVFEDGRAEAYNQFAVAAPGIAGGDVRTVAVVASDAGRVRQFRSSEFSSLRGSLSPIMRGSASYVGSFVSLSYALVVLQQRNPDNDLRPTLDEIELVVTRCLTSSSRFTLGVSPASPLELRSARQLRSQAITAAELAILDPALDRQSYWDELGAYRVLLDASGRHDQVLGPLDAAGSSAPMLLETLETFLDLAGDIQSVAARLALHRSSLYYRLDRIARILGVELSDGMTRLELHTALKSRRAHRRTLK